MRVPRAQILEVWTGREVNETGREVGFLPKRGKSWIVRMAKKSLNCATRSSWWLMMWAVDAEFREVIQTIQRGQREAARAKKEMVEANLRW